MTEPARIVFLYGRGYVPRPVLEAATRGAPPGTELELLESERPPGERLAALSRADFLVLYPGDLGPEELEHAPRWRLVQLLSAGFDRLDLERLRAAGVPVANNGGANAPTVAEHAIGLMLAVYKRIPMHDRSLRDGQWLGLRETLRMREIRGRTAGIVGFGRIGRATGRLLRAFGARVLYHDLVEAPPDVVAETGAQRVGLDALLEGSDIVTLHVPLDESTRHMIGEAELARMQPHAILVNTARGPVVDQKALVAALREGRIGGAGIDVFDPEPPAPGEPLVGLENVVVTPHIAGITIDTWQRRLEFGLENIARVLQGEPPLSRVDQ